MEKTNFELLMEAFKAAPPFEEWKLYDKWAVLARTENLMLAGWPKNAEAELAMLEARFRKGLVPAEIVEAARAHVAEAASTDHAEETEKASDKSTCMFKKDERGIYIESRQIKAGLREAATTLGKTSKDWGSKQVLQHALFAVGPEHDDRIYFRRDGKILTEFDGEEKMVAHINGPQGPRSTIKIHEYISPGTEFVFEIWRASSGNTVKINEKDLKIFLTLCQRNGWGASRSQGFGRVKILNLIQTAEGEKVYERDDKTPRKPRAKGKKAEEATEAEE